MGTARWALSAIAILFGLHTLSWMHQKYRETMDEIERDGCMQAMWHERVWGDQHED